MRFIVASDSHGKSQKLIDAVNAQAEASALFFLGDGEYDLQELHKIFPRLKIYAVAGNCDMRSNLPELGLVTIEGVKIMLTHGHRFAIKASVGQLLTAAKERGTQIALFGHTHVPYCNYENGVHLFNPGSIYEGSYGVIDITGAGIFCFHCRTCSY